MLSSSAAPIVSGSSDSYGIVSFGIGLPSVSAERLAGDSTASRRCQSAALSTSRKALASGDHSLRVYAASSRTTGGSSLSDRRVEVGRDDVVRHHRRAETGRGEARRRLHLRRPHGDPRLEAGAAARALDDLGQPVAGLEEDPLPVGERLERGRARAGERIGRGQHDDELLEAEPLERPGPVLRAPGRARCRRRPSAPPPRAASRWVYSRMRIPMPGCRSIQVAIAAREDADRHREQRRHLELARLEPERHARGVAGPLGRPHGRLRLRQQRPAGRGQPDAAGEPLEQRAAELRLERADLLGERRLGDAEPPRGARERALLDHGQKRREPPQVHRQSLSSIEEQPTLHYRSPGPKITCRGGSDSHQPRVGARGRSRGVGAVLRAGLRDGADPAPKFRHPVIWLRLGDQQLHLFQRDAEAPPLPPPRPRRRRLRGRLRARRRSSACSTPAPGTRTSTSTPPDGCRCTSATRQGNLVEIDWPDVTTLDRSVVTDIRKLDDDVPQTGESAAATLYTAGAVR